VKAGSADFAQRVYLPAVRNLTTESTDDTETEEKNGGENHDQAFLDLNYFSVQFRAFRGSIFDIRIIACRFAESPRGPSVSKASDGSVVACGASQVSGLTDQFDGWDLPPFSRPVVSP
jgi:hypothetical protein